MDFDISRSIFFIVSLTLIFYTLYFYRTKKRVHFSVEILFLFFIFCILIYSIFYDFFISFFRELGFEKLTLFLICFTLIVLSFVCFLLYYKSENHRIEISKLVSEIAILKNKKR